MLKKKKINVLTFSCGVLVPFVIAVIKEHKFWNQKMNCG